jgi:HSP20 family protein
MPARDANRGRGGGRERTGSRESNEGRGRQASGGASSAQGRAGAATGGSSKVAQVSSGRPGARTGRAGGTTTTSGGARNAGAAAASTAARSTAAPDVTPGNQEQRSAGRSESRVDVMGSRDARTGERSAAGAVTTSERERGFEATREAGPTMAASQVRQGVTPQGATRAATRAQGGQGVAPWFIGAESPLAMIRRAQEDLDNVFRVFGLPRLGPTFAPNRELEELIARSPALTQAAQWSPQIEVVERDDSLLIRADLPGVKRDDVEVNVENEVLTIRGQRRQEHREAEGGYRRSERTYGTFYRQIPLPQGVDAGQIEASYEDGVLEVTVPSPRDTQRGRRRIEIR